MENTGKITEEPRYSTRQRREIRAWVRSQSPAYSRRPSTLPIRCTCGGGEPRTVGERGYHTTPSGKTIVRYPNAYGWRVIYHCSTQRIEVGSGWLRARGILPGDLAL